MSLYKVYADDKTGKKQKVLDQLDRNLSSAIDYAKAQKTANYRLVFSNPDGLTPQEVFDALGTDAVKFLTLSTQMLAVIRAVDPSYTPPVVAQTLTPNQDGTVTVS